MSAPTAALTKNEAMPEADAVLLLKRLLAPLAQRHHGGHVHLVEGGEHGGVVLRLDEPAGDRRAALGHAHAFFAAVAGLRSGAVGQVTAGR